LAPNSPEFLLLKFCAFLSHHLEFHNGFHHGLLGGCILFLQLALDIEMLTSLKKVFTQENVQD